MSRKFFGLIAAFALIASASIACSSNNSDATSSSLSPSKAIESFYQACRSHSYDLAKNFISPGSVSFFEEQEKKDPNKGFRAFVDYCATNLNAPDFRSLRSENEKVNGNNADVDVAFLFADDEPEFIPHKLVRENDWRIDMISTLEPLNAEPRDGYRKDLENSGRWLSHPKYGQVWRPADVGYDWQPYCNDGRFARTDEGWEWQSDREWGDRVFHYGRWTQAGPMGWVWVPDDEYAPSWVTWRSNDKYVGWSPLRPGVPLSELNSGRPYSARSTNWIFVPSNDFANGFTVKDTRRVSYTRYRVPVTQYREIISSSTPYYGLRSRDGRVINEGIDLSIIERVTGIRIVPTRTVIIEREGRRLPPGHGGVPPGLYVRERAWEKNDRKKWEKEERKRDKEEWKRIKKEDKEWRKEGKGHGHGRGKGHWKD